MKDTERPLELLSSRYKQDAFSDSHELAVKRDSVMFGINFGSSGGANKYKSRHLFSDSSKTSIMIQFFFCLLHTSSVSTTPTAILAAMMPTSRVGPTTTTMGITQTSVTTSSTSSPKRRRRRRVAPSVTTSLTSSLKLSS